jgi:magnesium-transporting ATPase (P-type)
VSPMPGLATTHSGLSTDRARELLETHGPNTLPVVKGRSALRQLFAQFFSFFAVLLWVAGALAFVAGLAELGVAIFGVIVLNGGFAFIQEHRAERAGDRLREIVPRRATVIRDGQPYEIDSVDLVPGDLVSLAGGDRIGADMTAVETHSVTVDESTLSGESLPTRKTPGTPSTQAPLSWKAKVSLESITPGATRNSPRWQSSPPGHTVLRHLWPGRSAAWSERRRSSPSGLGWHF